MKPFAASLAALLLLASAAYGQDQTYYYSDERQVPLEKAKHWTVIQIPQSAQSALEAALAGQSDVRLRKVLDPERDFYWLEAKEGQPLDTTTIDELSSQVPIQRTFPAFFRRGSGGDTTRFLTTDQFSAKFAPGVSRAQIDAFNAKHSVEVVPLDNEIDRWQAREHNEYPLRVTEASDLSALEAANRYYESALTVWSVPDFYVNLQTEGPVQSQSNASDSLYPEQYYLNNTSSNLGTPDVDIDAPEAWNLSKGSSSITVAVVDDGVEQHEDFGSGQLVPGTSADGGDGSPRRDQKHGQAVAGIIGANHNSKGVRGVAPNVKIMPINIFDGRYGEPTADAIDYAWQNGADVLNNSWGFGESNEGNDPVADAIQRARQNGRNGKGSVVVTSASNTGDKNDVVKFPGTVPGVLAVGAVDKNDNKQYYSPCNDLVDVVAPSGGANVRTTDRMGSKGYNPSGNYYRSAGQTSMAAPQATGVAALILSVNPDLTELEVRNTIRYNADDYGTTSCGSNGEQWNGDGRLNAFKALDDAVPPLSVSLSGPYALDTHEQGTWSTSVSGGYGSISNYNWEYQPTNSNTWGDLGCADSDCSHIFVNYTNSTQWGGIRVTVTKGIETDTASRSIEVSPTCSSMQQKICLSSKANGQDATLRNLKAQSSSDGTATLTWKTAGSVPPSRFIVQHRRDSTAAWEKVGTVRPADSVGTSAETGPTYQFQADRLDPGPHQFRLAYAAPGPAKQSMRASQVVTATVEMNEAYRLATYPNPVQERATVELAVKEQQEVTVRVYDVLGRSVTTLRQGPMRAQQPERLSLDASEVGLSSGTYFVRVQGEDFVATERLTVVQ